MKDHYDICVAGFWYGANYGSLLNGYAEYCLLKKEFGKEVLMLNKVGAPSQDTEVEEGHNTEFVRRYYDPQDVSPPIPYAELSDLNKICDAFCAGSDQIWNYSISFRENMYLPFAGDDKKLISFATSFGHKSDKTPDEAKPRVRKYLQRFSSIAVREQFDADILRNNYNIDGTLVFEPVFCIDKKYYDELIDTAEFNETEPYLLTYILDPSPEKREAIQFYAEKLGLKTVNILDGVAKDWEKNKQELDLPGTLPIVGAADFLKAFKNAAFVITDSFHGSAFSIIFNKPFIAIGNYKRGFERFIDLLGRLKLEDRLIISPKKIPHDEKYLAPIDYTETNEIIRQEAERTVEWLRRAVETPKEEMPSILLPDETPAPYSYTFSFDHDVWEEYYAGNTTTLFVKPGKSAPGRFATRPLGLMLEKGKSYTLRLRFKARTDSDYINFHLKDANSSQYKVIYYHKVDRTRLGVWEDAEVSFTALSSLYNQLMIGASQITGPGAYISIAEMYVFENKPESADKDQSVAKVVKNGTCTGCSVCAQVCPKQAITMRENDGGFLNPVIDGSKCVNCGLCLKKCISENPVYKNNPEPECYAMMANDELRMVSSSGGMFSVAAEYVLDHGGYVCGAVYNGDFSVKHVVISNTKDLPAMRGSKYIQSHVEQVYPQIKKLLNEGKTVLFTGMPCQNAALYSYLGKDYENLYTIDILCHGMTTHKVLEKYRRDIHQNKKLKHLGFKEKKPWGWHAGVNAKFADGSSYAKPLETDRYFNAYLRSLSKNTACESCPANKLPRQADLTIGDFWKIETFKAELNDKKGTSVVLINNEKGQRFFDKLIPFMQKCEKAPLDTAKNGNHIIYKAYKLHKNRQAFFDNFDLLGFDTLVAACSENKIYEAQKIQMLRSIPEEEHAMYYLARTAVKNAGGRKIVTWSRSPLFEKVLHRCFGRQVAFSVAQNEAYVDNSVVFPFDKIVSHSNDYYVVVPAIAYNEERGSRLSEAGYQEIADCLFKTPKPIVIENYDLAGGFYSDAYGNTIEGFKGVIKQIIFRGGNNHIVLGDRIKNPENLSFDLSTNSYISIGRGCSFTGETDFLVQGQNGSSKVVIKDGCAFQGAYVRVFNDVHVSSILINNSCWFGRNLELHANQGKKMIIGRKSLFSYDIDLWAGDAHSVFDVKSGTNVNSIYDKLPMHKNLLVIGEHVWVAKGAFIMHGTNIGDGSIVGAKSVVKGIYPNNCTIAGNPASLIKRDSAWSSEKTTEDPAKCGGYYAMTSDAKAPISGRKVLVIGGTRFMGVHLVKELIARGNDVTIATRGRRKDPFGLDVKRLKLDVSDAASTERALKGKCFDVVFDNLAYASQNANNILSHVKCGKYVQLSSVETYAPDFHPDLREEDFDPMTTDPQLCSTKAGYVIGKRQAEIFIYHHFPDVPVVTVRIPYVSPAHLTNTDRPYYYCKHIVNQTPMNIEDINRGYSFIRDQEVGKFLPWIAAQDHRGPINLSSTGMVTIQQIFEYIEQKVGKKPIIDNEKGEESPFHVFGETTFSMNTEKSEKLGYATSSMDSWFWKVMDDYIEMALKEEKK